MFHTLNHGVFKCLLFLGAGSVLHATHTRNMEEMGGLIRRMPSTALYFLIGAIAISGLPPLNGFVSEWLTYQALLAGFGATTELTRVALPDRRSAAGADGGAGRGLFRQSLRHHVSGAAAQLGERSRRAKSAVPCAPAWRCSPSACVVLGLGADVVPAGLRPGITPGASESSISQSLVCGQRLHPHGGLAEERHASPPWCWPLMLVALSVIPLLFWLIWGRRSRAPHRSDLGLRPARV